jgi:hypothetical protein
MLVAASGWWFGYFLFSLFFFPAALIVAYMVHDRAQPAVA